MQTTRNKRNAEVGCLQNLAEVILYVENMQEMVEFYRDALGLTLGYPLGQASFRDCDWVEFDTGACRLCLHSGGQRRHGADAPCIVFRVTDMETARDELEERGVVTGEPRVAAPGVWVCGGEDPEGNRFSLEHRAK